MTRSHLPPSRMVRSHSRSCSKLPSQPFFKDLVDFAEDFRNAVIVQIPEDGCWEAHVDQHNLVIKLFGAELERQQDLETARRIETEQTEKPQALRRTSRDIEVTTRKIRQLIISERRR